MGPEWVLLDRSLGQHKIRESKNSLWSLQILGAPKGISSSLEDLFLRQHIQESQRGSGFLELQCVS